MPGIASVADSITPEEFVNVMVTMLASEAEFEEGGTVTYTVKVLPSTVTVSGSEKDAVMVSGTVNVTYSV